jgi:hypothetical protein
VRADAPMLGCGRTGARSDALIRILVFLGEEEVRKEPLLWSPGPRLWKSIGSARQPRCPNRFQGQTTDHCTRCVIRCGTHSRGSNEYQIFFYFSVKPRLNAKSGRGSTFWNLRVGFGEGWCGCGGALVSQRLAKDKIMPCKHREQKGK